MKEKTRLQDRECALCNPSSRAHEIWDSPLFESDNFVVIPSLGALVEGWLLIVPKAHFISFRNLSAALLDEFEELKRHVVQVQQNLYGAICGFEHGPAACNRTVGCGVDHAHFHLVPYSMKLTELATPFLPMNAIWYNCSVHQIKLRVPPDKDYLYLEQPIGNGMVLSDDNIQSQVFRRGIADSEGISEQYNWRQFSQQENVIATIKRIGALERGNYTPWQKIHV